MMDKAHYNTNVAGRSVTIHTCALPCAVGLLTLASWEHGKEMGACEYLTHKYLFSSL